MYGIAYVIIPTEFASLQAVVDEALAPFRRGGPDDFPREKLAFDDVTASMKRLHTEAITLRTERCRRRSESAHIWRAAKNWHKFCRRFLGGQIAGDRSLSTPQAAEGGGQRPAFTGIYHPL